MKGRLNLSELNTTRRDPAINAVEGFNPADFVVTPLEKKVKTISIWMSSTDSLVPAALPERQD
jgi:hypothetical protein